MYDSIQKLLSLSNFYELPNNYKNHYHAFTDINKQKKTCIYRHGRNTISVGVAKFRCIANNLLRILTPKTVLNSTTKHAKSKSIS